MTFVDSNGEPRIILHKCIQERLNSSMLKTELHKFSIELLSLLYEEQGMTIKDVNRIVGYEYPQFVMTSRNGKTYCVAVKTTVFPTDPFNLPHNDCEEIKLLAKQFNAIPVFAGMGFANATGSDFHDVRCGGAFFVSFKGL